MQNMCMELYNGNIDADPLISSVTNPCSYCNYWSVCGITETDKHREFDKDAEKLMLEKLSLEEE